VILAALSWPLAGEAQTELRAHVYASGFSSPVAFVQDPTDRSVQYVVEQAGRIRVVRSGAVLAADFLDLSSAISSGGERGLLGMAFSPDYISSRRFYVNFTDPSGNTVIARFRRSAGNPLVADPGSRFDLRWGGPDGPSFIAQPFANHNGGHLAFGPDGFLYIGLGDGGSGDDPAHRAQNPSVLLGKMLRVDVNVPDDDASGYRVPPSNPFVGTGALPEIWSFGLRNPWRYSFDDPTRGGTGALVIGDVGQGQWEEIDYEPPNRGGRNYGWRNREGAHTNLSSPEPAFQPLVDPIHEYSHNEGASVTGGYVYRGRALGPAYRGRYFFADLTGRVWSLALSVNPVTGEAQASNLVEHTESLGGGAQLGLISSFGTGWDAELFIVSYSEGTILKIGPSKIVPARDGDFDGDGRADVTVFRPSTGVWYIRGSSGSPGYTWGGGADIPVAGDYDGDGMIDAAVFRPSNGTWYVLQSGNLSGTIYAWGGAGDIPVPGDYDGDGKTDRAVFRPSTGTWYIVKSSTMIGALYNWGGGADLPVPGDYDGDGKTDIAVFRPSTGTWYVVRSSTMMGALFDWGGGADIPVPGDYDGDGRTDVAVFRPSNGTWYLIQTGTMTGEIVAFGGGADIPAPGDYDGDGQTDIAVFRPSTGVWYVINSSTRLGDVVAWGGSGDIPIP
jgi:glucose/arabinose dehydrogenase